jgi:hypothetical protein
MTDKTIDLDRRRGMKTQKATDLRRLLAEVETNERLCLPRTKSGNIDDEVRRESAG